MVRAKDVLTIYQSLSDNGIQVWLSGGWGIDALLGRETREHKDLDVLILVDDVVPMRDLLARAGYALHELWSENTWTVDAHGTEIPTAFVLQDREGRQVDAHAMRLDDQGNGVPAWEHDGFAILREHLAGEGTIAGVAIRCISPESQVLGHTGYELPQEQARDLALLQERFGVGHPDQPAGT
jgi:lincosamide nucleotidyltransferase A/C/D/E